MKPYVLERKDYKQAILGAFIDPDGVEMCKTLENPYLDNQIFISSIPYGSYDVKSYSSDKYPDVWEIQDVPGRSKILFHMGNTTSNTKGCVLVGEKFGILNNELAVLTSRKTLDKLRGILPSAFKLIIKPA